MNEEAFFAAVRPYFGGSLTQPQVDGMKALLLAGANLPLPHMANVLAQVKHETGGYMAPIKETVMPSHKDKNPSDVQVISRLDRAWKAGKLPWVKEPYWRDGWFGRGQLQVTHRRNYAKFGISNPADMLRMHISAHVAVKGMSEGLFTGKKLSDYRFPDCLDAPPASHPRRIVNGKDGTDKTISRYHQQFAEALLSARWAPPKSGPLLPTTPPDVPVTPFPKPAATIPGPREHWLVSLWKAIIAAITRRGF